MKPWHKIPSATVLAGMRLRLSEDRAASEVEAIAEMHLMEETGELEAMSFLALANHLRWNRHRLRAALASWGKLAAAMPDQQGVVPSMALPQTRPDNFPTVDRQLSDNSPTTTRQRRATFKANFRVAADNSPTTFRQLTDNSPTASCARASSSCREEDRDRDLTTRARTTEPTLFAEPAVPAPAPTKRRKTKPAGPADEEVVAACAPAWRVIRGLAGGETPKATDQKAILALWRGVRSDYTDVAVFGEDLLAVATWAHSNDPDARNNLQGLRPNGSRWGPDRSRDVATITRQDRWADRLAKARQFAQAASEARQAISTCPDGSGPILTERERSSMDLTRRQNEFIARQDEEMRNRPPVQNRYRRLNELLADRPVDLTVT